MKKILFILSLLFVAGICFAGQPDDRLMEIRKIVSPKLEKMNDKEFKNVKYLMNPKNKITYLGTKQLNDGKEMYFFTGSDFYISLVELSKDFYLGFSPKADKQVTINTLIVTGNKIKLISHITNKEVVLDR